MPESYPGSLTTCMHELGFVVYFPWAAVSSSVKWANNNSFPLMHLFLGLNEVIEEEDQISA